MLELPLAEFFVSKLLGKHANLDELGSLDSELANNLDFLKRHGGGGHNRPSPTSCSLHLRSTPPPPPLLADTTAMSKTTYA